MKKILLIISLFLSISCFAQEKTNINEPRIINMLTNDSAKYWDCIYYDNSTNLRNKFGLCFDRNKFVFIYQYFRGIKFQRIYDAYSSQIYNYRISNDTIDISNSWALYKIEYISKDSLVLSIYNCHRGRNVVEIYKPSPDQQSRPMPDEYWYEIYKEAIKNNQDTLIYKKP
jgi:hypothetical protein